VVGVPLINGFAIATAALHGVGIAAAVFLGARFRNLVRAAGAACVAIGVALIAGAL